MVIQGYLIFKPLSYFQNLQDVQTFSYELQRSIITCNKQKTTQVLGDKLPQNEIRSLRLGDFDRFIASCSSAVGHRVKLLKKYPFPRPTTR